MIFKTQIRVLKKMKTTGGFHFTSVLGVLTFLTTRDLFFLVQKIMRNSSRQGKKYMVFILSRASKKIIMDIDQKEGCAARFLSLYI